MKITIQDTLKQYLIDNTSKEDKLLIDKKFLNYIDVVKEFRDFDHFDVDGTIKLSNKMDSIRNEILNLLPEFPIVESIQGYKKLEFAKWYVDQCHTNQDRTTDLFECSIIKWKPENVPVSFWRANPIDIKYKNKQ